MSKNSAYRVTFRARNNERPTKVVKATTTDLEQAGPSTSSAVVQPKITKKLEHNKRPLEKTEKESQKKRKCRICETTENVGIHLGTPMCIPCDAFFRRCLDDPVSFYLKPCITRKQNCLEINLANKSCAFCRAKKCLQVGVSRNKLTEKACKLNKDHSDIVLQPQEIGMIDCEEMVRLLKKASHWGKPSKEKQKKISELTKAALRRGITEKWWGTRYPGIHYDYAQTVDEMQENSQEEEDDDPPILAPSKKLKKGKNEKKSTAPIPILPKAVETSSQPQVVLIQVPTNGAAPTPAQINAIVSSLSSAGVVGGHLGAPQQITVTVRKPDLTAQQIGAFLTESFSNALERVKRIRFEQDVPLCEFLDASTNKAKRFLYNSSERPVSEHWRRIEAHINDLLCVLVKFAKLLPDFDNLCGDDQHTLLSGTLLEMFFISSVFFIDERAKRFYLNSGCVYSLSYLAYVFSGCSGAGDFFRSLFDFCRRLQGFVAFQDDETRISYDRLGLVLALTLFSPSRDFKIRAEESQKQILDILKGELNDDSRLTSLLECLSSLSSLTTKHKRMVTSIRDDALINLAIDLHAELLQLPAKRGSLSSK